MEFTIIVLLAMCFATPTTAVPSIPRNSSGLLSLSRTLVSDTGILVKLLLFPRVNNATVQMKLLYPFIASSNYFQEPFITLGLDLNKGCSRNQQAKDKLEILYSQMAVFMDPLYLAFFFEDAQGPMHRRLASVLDMASYFLNDTVLYVKRQMKQKGFTVPAYHKIPEAKLDERTRLYLDMLVRDNLVTLTITDNVVKIYRNYVIVYMLHDVIIDIDPCL